MPFPASRDVDGPLAAAVARLLDRHVDAGAGRRYAPPPGALLAVAHGDGRVEYAAGGDAVRAGCGVTAPVEWAVRTDVGSVTKIVATTAALMALVDSGELAPTTPVGRFLPGIRAAESTVAAMLQHRAGLWEWWPLYVTEARGEDAAQLAGDLPLRYRAGAERHYSDLGFILLGELVRRVTGGELAAAVAELVLEPFGLTETRFGTPAPGAAVAASSTGDAIEREMIATGVPYPVAVRADPFNRWRTHVLIGEVNDGNSFHAFGGVAGHAGLFSTAGDLLRFAEQLRLSLLGGGPIPPPTARTFLTAGPDPTQALGLRIWSVDGTAAYGHTGFPGVAVALLPERSGSAVLITNRLHADGSPTPTEPMWLAALEAAARRLREG